MATGTILIVLAVVCVCGADLSHGVGTLRKILSQRARDVEARALALVVDLQSTAAVRLAQDAVSGVPADSRRPGEYLLQPFQRSSLHQHGMFGYWADFRNAVLALEPAEGVAEVAGIDALTATQEAARSSPYAARVLVVTGSPAPVRSRDPQEVANTVQDMWGRGTQVDVWQFGSCQDANDTLRIVVRATGGTFYCEAMNSRIVNSPLKEVTLAVRRGLVGASSLPFRVDSSVTRLEGALWGLNGTGNATLVSPQGRAWNIIPSGADAEFVVDLPQRDATDYSKIRFDFNDADRRAPQPEPTTGVRQEPASLTGVWTLKVSSLGPVDAEVRARSRLAVVASVASVATSEPLADVAGNHSELTSAGDAVGRGRQLLRLRAEGRTGGEVTSVRLLDQSGRELSRLVRSSLDAVPPKVKRRQSLEGEETELLDDSSPDYHTSQWDVHELPDKPILVETTGHDRDGEVFTRVSNLTQAQSVLLFQPPVIIELAQRSQLYVQAGRTTQLQFELTNKRDIPVRFEFRLRDDRRYIRGIRPVEAVAPPQQTITIEASLSVPQNEPDGATDKVTLTARSVFEITTKSALVYVGEQYINDYTYPYVWWSWKSVCKGAWEPSNCNTNTWTVDWTIQDKESGLLTVSTVPRGVQFREEFVSGTREPVKAFYSASCCAKKVDLTVTDVQGNILRQTYDVGTQFLSDGEIAAIAMGILAIILLVAVIILAVFLCRRRESRRLERSHLGSRH